MCRPMEFGFPLMGESTDSRLLSRQRVHSSRTLLLRRPGAVVLWSIGRHEVPCSCQYIHCGYSVRGKRGHHYSVVLPRYTSFLFVVLFSYNMDRAGIKSNQRTSSRQEWMAQRVDRPSGRTLRYKPSCTDSREWISTDQYLLSDGAVNHQRMLDRRR